MPIRLQTGRPAPPNDRRAAGRLASLRSALGNEPPTTALVLDLGGVVLPTLFEHSAADLPSAGPFGEDGHYGAVERGEVQERDYWRTLMNTHPQVDIEALWRDGGAVRPEFKRSLATIQTRFKVVGLTNDMAHWFGEDWMARFPSIAAFDHVIEASSLGALKPDPRVFTRLCERIGERPERCLFVDDLPANLGGARTAGMEVQLFDVRDPRGAVRRLLRRLGVDQPAHERGEKPC